MPTIAITTDFGTKDGNVGVMKGVIWSICPEAQIADVSHRISPQNVPEAALILSRSVPYFPDETIHLVVVDPGVGTRRRPMAGRIGRAFFVGPDNGLITLWLGHAESEGQPTEFIKLDKPEYWLPQVSHVFHGRDIFAPAAAHLARGVSLHELGTMVTDPLRLTLPSPRRTSSGWQGQVIHVDHFGNVASNIRDDVLAEWLSRKEDILVEIGGVTVQGLVNTFGERASGEVVALLGSTGNLIVSVVDGDAASTLGIGIGDTIKAELRGEAEGTPKSQLP